jgi:hypothetical protein
MDTEEARLNHLRGSLIMYVVAAQPEKLRDLARYIGDTQPSYRDQFHFLLPPADRAETSQGDSVALVPGELAAQLHEELWATDSVLRWMLAQLVHDKDKKPQRADIRRHRVILQGLRDRLGSHVAPTNAPPERQ